MSRLSPSHFRKKGMKNEAESDDLCQLSRASIGLSGPVSFNHLAGGITFLDDSDTDSEEENILAPKPAEPHLQAPAVTTTTEKRTVGFGPPKRADAASETRQLSGTSVLDRSATFTGSTNVLRMRNGVRFSTGSAAMLWPNAAQAKARLSDIVRMLGGSEQLVSFSEVQSAYYSRYGDPLDKKEMQKLFGTQPTLKALREHCPDVFEINERSGLIELRMRNEGSASSTSTFSSVPSDPLPSVTSARQNYTNQIFRPITVTVAPLTNNNESAGASKLPLGRIPSEGPDIYPTTGADRSFVSRSSHPAVMQSYVRPTSSFAFSAHTRNATLTTLPPRSSNRITPVFKPINSGSSVLPSQTVAPSREPVVTQKKKPLPGYTSRGDGDFTESDSDEENEYSCPAPVSDHASNDVVTSRAHPNLGAASTNNGTTVASEAHNQLAPANPAVAGGNSKSKSIFARCPSPDFHRSIPKTAAVRNVVSEVPRFNWDQRQAMQQPNDALRGQADNMPATSRNGLTSNAQCTNDHASIIRRKPIATGNASGSGGHCSRASSRLSRPDDKLQSMRDIVFAMVKYRHPTPTPLPDIVRLLEQASSNGIDVHGVLGTSTWEFVGTIAGLNVYEDRGLIFCAVGTERSDN